MKSLVFIVFVLLAGLLQPSAWSTTVAELQSAGHLEISSELHPAQGIVPGQRVALAITIATDTWFTGGTRLEIPEVAGLVILQTNDFASNSSENRNGQTWVVQRWTLDIFPQQAGRFTLPSIAARIKVSDPNANSVEGELYSPKLSFQSVIPQSLVRAEQWVAAPAYTVSQSFDRELENLKVGDAIQREIVFEATDIMAMMLPALKAEKLEGLAAYAEPSSLSNNSNRGDTTARRVERITYVAEADGQYQLPARDFFWWDTRKGELQIRYLPAVDIIVGVGADVSPEHTGVLEIAALYWRRILLAATGIVLFLGVSWLVYTRAKKFPLARVIQPLIEVARRLNQMRKPALPQSLNPDGSAGE